MSEATAPLPVPVSVVCPRCKGSGKQYGMGLDGTDGCRERDCAGSGLVPALLPAREVDRLVRERVKAVAGPFSDWTEAERAASPARLVWFWHRGRQIGKSVPDVLAALGCPEETP